MQSPQQKIDMLHDEWDEEDKQAEVDRIYLQNRQAHLTIKVT